MNLEDFTITHDPLNGISEVESNIKTSSCKKQKIQFDTEFSDCSVDQGEDENSESELPRGALKFLKINLDKKKILFKIDNLEKHNRQLIAANEALLRENKMLRENNIKFQLTIYNFENPKDQQNENRLQDDFEDLQELNPPSLSEVMVKESFVEEYEVFEASDDEYEAIDLKPKMSNYSLDRQKEIISKYKLQLQESEKYQLDNIDEGRPNDQKFINKLLLILFDRNTLAYSSVSGKTNKNNKFDADQCLKLDTNKVDFIKDLLEFRITRENVDMTEKDERLKKLNYMIKAKINNLRKSTIKI